jgi:hypothetical protein
MKTIGFELQRRCRLACVACIIAGSRQQRKPDAAVHADRASLIEHGAFS